MTDDLSVTCGYEVDDVVTGLECPGSLDDVDFFVSVAGRVSERATNELDDCGSVTGERRANNDWSHRQQRDRPAAREIAKSFRWARATPTDLKVPL